MNIVGINGYIGSGKDETGKIIQLLTRKKTGPHWDSTHWDVDMKPILSNMPNPDWNHLFTWEIRKYATKLKQIASILTGISVEKFEDQEFKKTYLGPEWDYVSGWETSHLKPEDEKNLIEKLGVSYYKLGDNLMTRMTVREFLQKLGTEAIRTGIHSNAWVNALFADYIPVDYDYPNSCNFVDVYPKWLITDTRFENEAKAIKERRGIVIRVDRKKAAGEDAIYNGKYWVRKEGHPSEISLDHWDFDYIIDNNKGIPELIEEVKKMLEFYNLID